MVIQAVSLFQGFLIGLLVAIPLGPLAIITMKRTAEHGFFAGFVAGLTIATIDAFFAAIILFGIPIPEEFARPIPQILVILGSTLIFWYGLTMFRKKEIKAPKKISRWDYHFLDTLWLAFTNPSTYFAFGGSALLLSPFLLRSESSRVFIAIGFFLGTIAWWITIVIIAHKKRDTYLKNMTIQKILGVLVMAIALVTTIQSFFPRTYHGNIEKILKKL